MSNDKKKLDTSALLEIEKGFDESKEIAVGDYVLNVQKKFRTSQIAKVMTDVGEATRKLTEKELQVDPVALGTLFLIKHFTDLNVPDDLETQLTILDILIDSDLIGPIVSQFEPDELKKVADYMNQATMEIRAHIDTINKQMALIQAKVDQESNQEKSEDKGDQMLP